MINFYAVVPAQAGTQGTQALLDPRLRGDDTTGRFPSDAVRTHHSIGGTLLAITLLCGSSASSAVRELVIQGFLWVLQMAVVYSLPFNVCLQGEG